jgi:hypothetical protein
MKQSSGEEIYNIALKFKALTKPSDKILADPYFQSAGFINILAQRDVYVLFKVVPSTNFGIYLWRKRMELVGIEKDSFNKKNPDEMAKLLDEINYKYVLIVQPNESYYKSKKFRKFVEESGFVVFEKI